jgi:hypothetical protein
VATRHRPSLLLPASGLLLQMSTRSSESGASSRVEYVESDLHSWWEVVYVASFCRIFRKSLALPVFTVAELEVGFWHASESIFLTELHTRLLRNYPRLDGLKINDWVPAFKKIAAKRHLSAKEPVDDWDIASADEDEDEFLDDIEPFSVAKHYADLNLRQRVLLTKSLCDDLMEFLSLRDSPAVEDSAGLRILPFATDARGCIYFYFGDDVAFARLYKETPPINFRRSRKQPISVKHGRWSLVASDISEMEVLISKLKTSQKVGNGNVASSRDGEVAGKVQKLVGRLKPIEEQRRKTIVRKMELAARPIKRSTRVVLLESKKEHDDEARRQRERELEEERIALNEIRKQKLREREERLQKEAEEEQKRREEEEAARRLIREEKKKERLARLEEQRWELSMQRHYSVAPRPLPRMYRNDDDDTVRVRENETHDHDSRVQLANGSEEEAKANQDMDRKEGMEEVVVSSPSSQWRPVQFREAERNFFHPPRSVMPSQALPADQPAENSPQ